MPTNPDTTPHLISPYGRDVCLACTLPECIYDMDKALSAVIRLCPLENANLPRPERWGAHRLHALETIRELTDLMGDLTIVQVERETGLARGTIDKWRKQGLLTARRNGRYYITGVDNDKVQGL